MMDTTLNLIIWCVGVVGMAIAAWLQDRRDIRQEDGRLARLEQKYEQRISALEHEQEREQEHEYRISALERKVKRLQGGTDADD